MKLLKEKKNELYEVNKEFLAETLNASALLYEALSTFTNDKLKKESLKGVIQAEKKCDELKDKFTQVLFRDKRALPFLVEDRYKILMMIDAVNDKMEFFQDFLKCILSSYIRKSKTNSKNYIAHAVKLSKS